MERRDALLLSAFILLPACTHTPETQGKQFVNIDGIQVHYTQSGMGDKALLMIHGYGSGAFTWKGMPCQSLLQSVWVGISRFLGENIVGTGR